MPIQINSPITQALNNLQGTAMDMWKEGQRRRETEKSREMRYNLELLGQATTGLTLDSKPEDFKIALDAVKGFDNDKYLGKTSKLVASKIESLQGISQEKDKSIFEFDAMLDESRKAGKEWATEDMTQLLEKTRDIRIADLKYLSAQEKAIAFGTLNEVKMELTAKTLLSNLVGGVDELRQGKRPKGMSDRVFNSSMEALKLIEVGEWEKAISEITTSDEMAALDKEEYKLAGEARSVKRWLDNLTETDLPLDAAQDFKYGEALYKAGRWEDFINQSKVISDQIGSSQKEIRTNLLKGNEDFEENTQKEYATSFNDISASLDTSNDFKVKDATKTESVKSILKSLKTKIPESDLTDGFFVRQSTEIQNAIEGMVSKVDFEGGYDGDNTASDKMRWLMVLDRNIPELKNYVGERQEAERRKLIDKRFQSIDWYGWFPKAKGGEGAKVGRANLKALIEAQLLTIDARAKLYKSRKGIDIPQGGQLVDDLGIEPTDGIWNKIANIATDIFTGEGEPMFDPDSDKPFDYDRWKNSRKK